MNIEITTELYTKDLLRYYPDKIFVFGDNMKRYGKGRQAIIRDEPNAFGIATKRYPYRDDWAYFSDKEDEKEFVLQDLRSLYKLAQHKVIVFPAAGIGTGLAEMEKRSPMIWNMMYF
jgi:hypothetical protein